MPAQRPFALMRTHDQWLRASHDATALSGEIVQLYWRDEKSESIGDDKPFLERGAGLAFDQYCRLYHSVPAESRVERLLWAAHDPLQPPSEQATPVDLFATDLSARVGDFEMAEAPTAALREPRGLTIDEENRLFIAEAGARRILIYDLWSKRLLRRVQLNATPLDLATDGRKVYALLAAPPGLVRLDARTGPQPVAWPGEIVDPARIAIAPSGELFVLERAGTLTARIVKFAQPAEALAVKFATDLEFQTGDQLLTQSCTGSDQVLVVARRPGEDLLRFCISTSNPNEWSELPPLKARNYDGLGLVLAPDGRIAFWTKHGLRHAVAARLRYLPEGSVITHQLDSGEFHTVWGRIFLDACIPKGTSITVRCITADEPPSDAPIKRGPPANTNADPPHTDQSPPLPPQSLAEQLERATEQRLHRRETGRELPWVRAAENDPFETFEAPVLAAPGRYLWLRIELRGETRTTPRLRTLRVEYPTHDYLRRIPRMFSRDEQVASFLERYLALFEGPLGEWEAKADARRALLDPRSAPAEILPWLAGFLGVMFDERMARAPQPGGRTVDVRRRLIAEATWLFRFRGTVRGLSRFLEIYLGIAPLLIEKFRVRGMGGALLGSSSALAANSVLGAGFRIGGAIGESGEQTLAGTIEDAFATHAHRFAVIIPAALTTEQSDVVAQILELHRPAHTLVEVCTVGAGMRVGRGLHVELTSLIGRSGGFESLQLGESLLGRGAILGRPEPGTSIGGSQLGKDSRIG